MTEPNYGIKYKKGDFEVELRGDKAWVEAKFKELTTTEIVKPSTTILPQTSGSSTKLTIFPESLVEFLKSKNSPKKHNVLVVIFGYWLYHKQKQQSFNTKDIEKCYDDARIKESSNTSQYLNDAQGNGLFKRLEEKKDNQVAWTITQAGDNFVDNTQRSSNEEAEPETGKAKKKTKGAQMVTPIPLDLTEKPNRPSLRDFYKEKKPVNSAESVVVFTYYLKEYLKMDKIEPGHVSTCCKDVDIKVPGNIPQMFYDIQRNQGWLNAGKGKKFAELNTIGENFVKYDLPRKDDASKN